MSHDDYIFGLIDLPAGRHLLSAILERNPNAFRGTRFQFISNNPAIHFASQIAPYTGLRMSPTIENEQQNVLLLADLNSDTEGLAQPKGQNCSKKTKD